MKCYRKCGGISHEKTPGVHELSENQIANTQRLQKRRMRKKDGAVVPQRLEKKKRVPPAGWGSQRVAD